ncbi:hypothetical protein ACIBO5_55965 [Nonomuraea angiospora]|uniref:hypothetical protein n=1 Tax=Nonomuraea angiospora TaxID=46172 RepID=UPI00299F9772|nr:hypothetical protein [Nonomuraea angiospora]MDX3104521.1 hypothetical protein [Nonomuraea angiospora]
MLISGWSRAQRLAELGWGEWDLATWQVIWTPQMYDMLGLDPGESRSPWRTCPTWRCRRTWPLSRI